MDRKSTIYMLLAGFFFALMNIAVKYVSHIPTMEVVLFRSVVSLVLSFVLLKNLGIPILGNHRVWLTLRGIAGCIGLIGSFYTLQHMPLATAVTLNYLSPFFTALLGIFFVQQKLRPAQYLYFALAIMGVWMMKGFDSRVDTLDMLIGIAAAFFAAIAYNIIARLKSTEHPFVIIFYFPLVTIPVAAIYCYWHWYTPVGIEWAILILIGLFTQAAQYYMTKAYQSANLAKVASLNYLGVIYALIFGYFLFDETMNAFALLGMGCILISIVLNLNTKATPTKN